MENLNTELLKEYVEGALAQNLNVRQILVRQHGKVIASQELLPVGRVHLFSGSKSVMALGVGCAIAEGYFSYQDKLVDLLSDRVPAKRTEGFDDITVEHLLTMSTGHDLCPVFVAEAEYTAELEARGESVQPELEANRFSGSSSRWFDCFFERPLAYKPGEYFFYNNGASYMLALILEKKTGMSVVDYMQPRIFTPLGINNVAWSRDPDGHCLGAVGLQLSAEEYAKIGQLYLNRGVWEGKQLVPAEYIDAATTKHIDNARDINGPENSCGYGYQVWMSTYPSSYRLDGMFSQICIVIPKLDAVITVISYLVIPWVQGTIYPNPVVELAWPTIVKKLEELP